MLLHVCVYHVNGEKSATLTSQSGSSRSQPNLSALQLILSGISTLTFCYSADNFRERPLWAFRLSQECAQLYFVAVQISPRRRLADPVPRSFTCHVSIFTRHRWSDPSGRWMTEVHINRGWADDREMDGCDGVIQDMKQWGRKKNSKVKKGRRRWWGLCIFN